MNVCVSESEYALVELKSYTVASLFSFKNFAFFRAAITTSCTAPDTACNSLRYMPCKEALTPGLVSTAHMTPRIHRYSQGLTHEE